MSGVWVQRTRAARLFREHTGAANYRLNTLVVGLEAVKRGIAQKPADLAVRWETQDAATAAELARSFTTNAIMVYVVDALDSYMADLASSDIWIADPTTASILRGEFQTDRSDVVALSPRLVREFAHQITSLTESPINLEETLREFAAKHFGRRKRPSLRARFTSLATVASTVQAPYDLAIQLLISWRNRHAHGRSTDRLSNQALSGLREASSFFYENHAHLDVARMIENYELGGAPTLKEVSSLISICHRVVASIDIAILNRADAHQAFMAALRTSFASETSPGGRIKEYWGRSIEARQSKLVAMTSRFGFREFSETDTSSKPLCLSAQQLRAIAELDREDFADQVGVMIASGQARRRPVVR
ncbi:hypothetical protein PKCBPO_03120 [Methylorubrum thiocyanatum]|uniref:hypothetical protein n=1 Tax=Methylorubrum thiocyanatum TaxID=47958 RepID=UPI0036680D1E